MIFLEKKMNNSLTNKPKFVEAQKVYFRINDKITGIGKIRGLASENIIDMWIVEIIEAKGIDVKTYEWSCTVMPHTLLTPVDENNN